jgi:hypothetical protein
MDYRIDVCRVTKGGNIENCKIMENKMWRVSISIGVRITMIRYVVYFCEFLKYFTDI